MTLLISRIVLTLFFLWFIGGIAFYGNESEKSKISRSIQFTSLFLKSLAKKLICFGFYRTLMSGRYQTSALSQTYYVGASRAVMLQKQKYT